MQAACQKYFFIKPSINTTVLNFSFYPIPFCWERNQVSRKRTYWMYL